MSLHSLQSRLLYNGGTSLGRIKTQKLRSLLSALNNDYNSRTIMTEKGYVCQALININSLKNDYDKESISVPFDCGIEEGDTFEILDNHTHWLVYLQDLVETAYFKSQIIRCRYTLSIGDNQYWVYFQGPTETDISWRMQKQTNYNDLNWSGTIYIKQNEETRDFFDRFTKFKIAGHTWETKVVDYISVPGIIEVEVGEYFDDDIAELPQIVKQEPIQIDDEFIERPIVGKDEVKIDDVVGYTILENLYDPEEHWVVKGSPYVEIDEVLAKGRVCKIKVKPGAKDEFDIIYGKYRMCVQILDERPEIIGPEKVYPYSRHEYKIDGLKGEFYLHTDLAKIVRKNDNSCVVEILSGRKGKFSLFFQEYGGSDIVHELPINILSM